MIEPRPRRTSEEVKPRVEKRMAVIDALSPELRAVVHEYGWNLTKNFIDHGITRPKEIKHLVHTVLYELRPTDLMTKDREGCVLAPREPSEAMIDAGLRATAVWLNIPGTALTVNREKTRLRYKAMLAHFAAKI